MEPSYHCLFVILTLFVIVIDLLRGKQVKIIGTIHYVIPYKISIEYRLNQILILSDKLYPIKVVQKWK